MRRLLAPLLCLALLTGCSGSLTPVEKLRDLTARVVTAANAKDPSSLRAAVESLRNEVEAQERGGQLSHNQATVLLRFLAQLESNAPLLTASPTPSPTPSPTASPTPSPTASPTPSPTVSPTPSPTPSPTASPTPSATLTIMPTLGVGFGASATPSP